MKRAYEIQDDLNDVLNDMYKLNYNKSVIQKIISNSWRKGKANQYHDGDFIPDKTYWRQKEHGILHIISP